jgi:hypothetical protein
VITGGEGVQQLGELVAVNTAGLAVAVDFGH